MFISVQYLDKITTSCKCKKRVTHTQKDIDTQVYERSDETKCEIESDAGMKPLLQYETTKYQIEILLKYNKNFDDDLSTSHTHTHRYTDT